MTHFLNLIIAILFLGVGVAEASAELRLAGIFEERASKGSNSSFQDRTSCYWRNATTVRGIRNQHQSKDR